MLRFLLCCLVLAGGLSLQAQENPTVFSVVGKAKHTHGVDTLSFRVRPGNELDATGTIALKKNTTVGILYDEEFTFLTGPGEFSLEEALDDMEESDALELLGARLEEASRPFFLDRAGLVKSDPKPQMPQNPTSNNGGNKDFQIIPLAPLEGKVSGQNIKFQWRLKEAVRSFRKVKVMVYDQDGAVLGDTITNKQEATLVASDLGLQTGNAYSWRIMAVENDGIQSREVTFRYLAEGPLGEIQKDLIDDDEAYPKASATAKMLMESLLLEEEGFYTESGQRLREAVAVDKRDKLAKWLLAWHEWSYGLIPE
ncbi:MAG: hypothetical protein AAFZ52_01155 [Bacteroidota bacterium]